MNVYSLAGAGKLLLATFAAALIIASLATTTRAQQTPLPDPRVDAPLTPKANLQTAVFAGGCFWGVEAVFEHVRGVRQVTSGYAGGKAASADYATVSSGQSGHAESVKITFDPSQVSYGQLLKIFFSVAHDPTQLNRQGPDQGPQYRSAIFFDNPEQKRIAASYVAQMGAAKAFGTKPIVTQIVALTAFYPAESYHQDFARLNPNYPYIVYHDAPKVARLKKQFPALYQDNWSAQRDGKPQSRG